MKKICFITTIYGTYHAFLKDFSYYLYETGEYDISLICDKGTVNKEDLPAFVHYFPIEMKRGVSLSAFGAIVNIKKILKNQKFDIVQYSTPNAAFYSSIAAKLSKIPVRLYCQWGIRYMGFKGLKRLFFKLLEKATCYNSTFIEAESHNIRDFSLRERLYSDKKSGVIWNGSACGVDLTVFDISKKELWKREIRSKLKLSEDDVVFAFAGRLTADKGVNELLEAFLQLEKKHQNAKLLIMGGMDNESSLNSELCDKAKKSSQIIFTGNVNDIEHYYAAADIFVAPSYREGFGLVVVEAEAMGIPAIVSDVPGQVDAIEPNVTGLTFAVKDALALEETMETMLSDLEKRLEMSKAAVQFVRDNFEQIKLFGYLKAHRDELVDGSK